MRSLARCFDELLAYCQSIPLVDCHDHTLECGPKHTDALTMLIYGYFSHDMHAASSDSDMKLIEDTSLPLEQRWFVFERAWKRTCHTGYAQVTRRLLKHFYGVESLSLAAVQAIQERLLDDTSEERFEKILSEANIAVRIEDCWPDPKKVLDGSLRLAPRSRLAISLPDYHNIRCYEDVQKRAAPLGRVVTSLDEYLETCREIFAGFKRYGAVCFKDQSAYERSLRFTNPSRAQAEEVFNGFMEDPRRSAAYPDGIRPLDDYLFHCFLRMARDLDLPVQIHTGHMAGVRNEITKTNAILLTSVLELHREVRFDLFHANWPYAGELLFLAKNYPNVSIDFCWTNIVDPIYCQGMFQQAVSSVPHGKIHGYGSDYGGAPEFAWAHAQIARENIAIALANLVEIEYLGLEEAKEVAYGWLFGNANAFFRLGLESN
ncbi:MAG TPA: amidohydrolase family protein [Anaerolineaceae bacterium]